MYLFLHELTHLLSSLAAGITAYIIVWGKKPRPKPLFIALVTAFVGGVLIDLDHLVDYVITFGLHFELRTFLEGKHFVISGKNFVPLHGWEYVLILVWAASRIHHKKIRLIVLALGFGVLSHLVVDTFLNSMPPLDYSILYRAWNNFEVRNLRSPNHYQLFEYHKQSL